MSVTDGQDIRLVLSESFETGEDYLPRLIIGMDRVVTLLRQGGWEEAKELFSAALEGLEWLLTVLEAGNGVPQLSKMIENYSEKLTDFRTIMKNLLDALSSRDLVLTGDIIEYELVDSLKYWLDIFGKLNLALKAECAN